MSKRTISTYVDDDLATKVEATAQEKRVSTAAVLRWALLDMLEPKISPNNIAVLTQIAKDHGLDNLDQAVEMLMRTHNGSSTGQK